MRKRLVVGLLLFCATVLALPIAAMGRNRVYHPTLGRFLQRDPAGTSNVAGATSRSLSDPAFTRRDPLEQYDGGMNLYQYVRSKPVVRLDPMGLWDADMHYGMTLAMASAAGLACPQEAAAYANKPDTDLDSAPGKAGGAEVAALTLLGIPGVLAAQAKVNAMADWHFPADPDGVVRPKSPASQAKMKTAGCDFKSFFMGLHVFQDSWAHQGKPFVDGVMHGRGFKQLPDGTFASTNGTSDAAFSGSADVAAMWPEDARETALETYNAIVDYIRRCPCECPGGWWGLGAKKPTKAHDPQDAQRQDWVDKQAWGKRDSSGRLPMNTMPNPKEVTSPAAQP